MLQILFCMYTVPNGSPINFHGNATSSRSALLTWSPPSPDHQNGKIKYYIINITAEESGDTLQFNSTELFVSVSTLVPHHTYTCVIAAATSVGIGPYSALSSFRTPQDCKKYIINNFYSVIDF